MLVAGAEAGRARVGPTAITPIPGSGCVADEEARRSAAALVDRSFGNIGLFNGVSAPRSWNIGCADSRGRRLVWFWHGTETAKYFVVDARRARLLLQSSSAETLEFVAATELNGDMVDEWIVVRRGELTTNYGLKEYLVLGTSLSRPLAVLPREAQFPPSPCVCRQESRWHRTPACSRSRCADGSRESRTARNPAESSRSAP